MPTGTAVSTQEGLLSPPVGRFHQFLIRVRSENHVETAGPALGPLDMKHRPSPTARLKGEVGRGGGTYRVPPSKASSNCTFLGKPAPAPAGSPKCRDLRTLIGTTKKQAGQQRAPR